jgi:hypothetical protein
MLWWQHPVLYLLHPGELPLEYFDDLFLGVAKALEMNVLEEDLERLANVPKLPSVATDLIQNSLLHVGMLRVPKVNIDEPELRSLLIEGPRVDRLPEFVRRE